MNSEINIKKKKLDWTDINGIEDTEKPPVRYNDAALINKMDPKNLNIGRPSTYASFIDKITKRKYVEIKDVDGKKIDVKTIDSMQKNRVFFKADEMNSDLVAVMQLDQTKKVREY